MLPSGGRRPWQSKTKCRGCFLSLPNRRFLLRLAKSPINHRFGRDGDSADMVSDRHTRIIKQRTANKKNLSRTIARDREARKRISGWIAHKSMASYSDTKKGGRERAATYLGQYSVVIMTLSPSSWKRP